MRSLVILMLCSGIAYAQPVEPVYPPGTPPAAQPPPPPPPPAKPPPGAYRYQPGPPPGYRPHLVSTDRSMYSRGQRDRVIGLVLIGVGSVAMVAGSIMTGVSTDCSRTYGPFHDHYDCVSSNDGLLAGGVVTGVAGVGMFVGGVVSYVIGSNEVHRSRRWALYPSVTSNSAQAGFHLTF